MARSAHVQVALFGKVRTATGTSPEQTLFVRACSRYVAYMPDTTRPRRIAPVDHDPEALKWARERAGWRATDLARAVGISRSLLSEAEGGTRGLSPAIKNKIAETLNCPVTVFERKTVRS
jgi:DNA-binding XRE family transcriptional regulator